MLLAVLVAAGIVTLYYFGRFDPVPEWITLPPDASINVCRMGAPPQEQPVAQATAGYFLQVRLPTDPRTAAAQVMGGVIGFAWTEDDLRPATRADVIRRAQWPQWIREKAYPVSDPPDGWVGQAPGVQGRLHIYSWKSDNGSIVELVQEVDAVMARSSETQPPLD